MWMNTDLPNVPVFRQYLFDDSTTFLTFPFNRRYPSPVCDILGVIANHKCSIS